MNYIRKQEFNNVECINEYLLTQNMENLMKVCLKASHKYCFSCILTIRKYPVDENNHAQFTKGIKEIHQKFTKKILNIRFWE